MKRLMAVCLGAALPALVAAQPAPPEPPRAVTRPYVVKGPVDRNDEYYWLRDDSRKNADVLAYLNAENAYADAWLRDGSALAADSVTLSPYLGFESLRPALDLAAATGRGVFVLALTSNPEGASVQHVGGADSVARRITEAAAVENQRYDGSLGSVGLVVGATVGSALSALDIDLAAVRGLLPAVATEYRQRLLDRVRQAVADAGVVLSAETVIREVALFADRSDVSEEVMRLSSHLDQFTELIRKGDEAGRKLEFVIQEMGRETNTIGSKAGDVAISRHVIEIKSTLEKLREQVQNVE